MVEEDVDFEFAVGLYLLRQETKTKSDDCAEVGVNNQWMYEYMYGKLSDVQGQTNLSTQLQQPNELDQVLMQHWHWFIQPNQPQGNIERLNHILFWLMSWNDHNLVQQLGMYLAFGLEYLLWHLTASESWRVDMLQQLMDQTLARLTREQSILVLERLIQVKMDRPALVSHPILEWAGEMRSHLLRLTK